MIRVELELWLGSDRQLGEDFQILSPVRSRRQLEVPEGTTLLELLRALGHGNPGLKELLLDPGNSALREDLVVLKNGRLQARSAILEEALSHGDQIRLVPVYPGG